MMTPIAITCTGVSRMAFWVGENYLTVILGQPLIT